MSELRSLFGLLSPAESPADRFLADRVVRLPIASVAARASLDGGVDVYRGRSVMVLTARQLTASLALIDLDGLARRIIIPTPDLTPEDLEHAVADAAIDLLVTDDPSTAPSLGLPTLRCGDDLPAARETNATIHETEWVLFTSGSTGRPKMAVHTLASLTGPLGEDRAAPDAVWSTFYDVRRYGGLQILLRALAGGASMIFSDPAEPVADFLARARPVTHISGTPSHWRRALMSGAAGSIAPGYVRLSGEIADQPILDRLRAAFPAAEIGHAFASTEAGVAFAVRDGRAGFPASLLDAPAAPGSGGVELLVEDGTLRIRSSRTARRYLDRDAPPLRLPSGFVDTGDLVERRGDRCHFVGRRGGVINVGGLKVSPEAVEAVLNGHEAVLMSRVFARKSPITGALVVAELVIDPGQDFASVEADILRNCRDALEPHQVPAILRPVSALSVMPSGKIARRAAGVPA